MAITLISNTVANAFGSITTSGIDTTGADFIVVGLAIQDSVNPTVSDSKSNTWTQVANTYTQTNVRVRMHYCIPSSVGTGHTFTSSGANNIGALFVAAFSGVKQTSPEDQQSGSNGFVSTIQPGSITPSADNSLIVTLLGINASASPMSIDSGFTETDEQDFVGGTSYGGCMAYLVQGTAAAINPTWTRTNTNGCAVTQVSFLPAAVAATRRIFNIS